MSQQDLIINAIWVPPSGREFWAIASGRLVQVTCPVAGVVGVVNYQVHIGEAVYCSICGDVHYIDQAPSAPNTRGKCGASVLPLSARYYDNGMYIRARIAQCPATQRRVIFPRVMNGDLVRCECGQNHTVQAGKDCTMLVAA